MPTAAPILIVVDMQNDFCPGGALAVAGGEEVVPVINRLLEKFDAAALTQDWHPADHGSFASQHPGKAPFETVEMPYGTQTLWPDHCVQGSRGAAFHDELDAARAQFIVRKGFRRDIGSYSAFFENDRQTPTGLAGYLRERGFTDIVLAGLATDFCVGFSALDARRLGFAVALVEDACCAIDLGASLQAMMREMAAAGVVFSTSDKL